MENLNTQSSPDPSVPFTVAPPPVCSEEEKEAAARNREEDDTQMIDVSGERQLHNEFKYSEAPRHPDEFYD
ncbi:hypothetical protein PsorP6_002250 [Peronosclerospora sorghi]|uniref:Uncharacterized protein n=1 Tax=Peronosclerospora sorghi TaxID=230839 RepID=A0ACC0WY53_9STRA|nr:hypothetical protein PsorP6_002250 [Peronosclerospora sorghi]